MPNHPPFSFPLVANDADELLEACCVYLVPVSIETSGYGVPFAGGGK